MNAEKRCKGLNRLYKQKREEADCQIFYSMLFIGIFVIMAVFQQEFDKRRQKLKQAQITKINFNSQFHFIHCGYRRVIRYRIICL